MGVVQIVQGRDSKRTANFSMFERRLALLAGVVLVVLLGLSTQMAHLAIVQGAEHSAVAERRLNLETLLPTERGRILDRRGRLLAINRPSYDVAVSYSVITGTWALGQATLAAKRANRNTWLEMSPKQRRAAADLFLSEFETKQQVLWEAIRRYGGIDQAELDRRLDAIKRDVQRIAAVVHENQAEDELRYGSIEGFTPRPIREQTQAHVVLPRLDNEAAFPFRRLEEEYHQIDANGLWPVQVQHSHHRVYPWSLAEVTLDRTTLPQSIRSDGDVKITVRGVADHILGQMRDEVWADDLARRPLKDARSGDVSDPGGYLPGDDVGRFGIERAFEDRLRGLRGLVRTRLDTGVVQRTEHVPGNDVQLTIDISLQARVHAILSPEYGLTAAQQYQAAWTPDGTPRPTIVPIGTPLASAAVVLDVESGEILATVSMPSIAGGAELSDSCRPQWQPQVNRAIDAIYPPGSILKPLMLSAAVREKVLRLDETIGCTGHFLPDVQDRLRCWVYRPPTYLTHGSLAAAEAMARSCNMYFYTIADRLGFERTVDWLGRFGLGEPTDIGLGSPLVPEDQKRRLGHLPDTASRDEDAGSRRFQTVSMGIGQGPVTWTPLQAANAYATIARHGLRLPATVVRDPSPGVTVLDDLALDDRLVGAILEGLRQSVAEEHGTGHHIRYPNGTVEPIIKAEGVTVWAKTGTAEAPPLPDLNCDGAKDQALDDPAHAWFVGLVGPAGDRPQPRYAIAIVVEYGGSGGRTAGPIANEIVRALLAEGYLTAAPAREAAP